MYTSPAVSSVPVMAVCVARHVARNTIVLVGQSTQGTLEPENLQGSVSVGRRLNRRMTEEEVLTFASIIVDEFSH